MNGDEDRDLIDPIGHLAAIDRDDLVDSLLGAVTFVTTVGECAARRGPRAIRVVDEDTGRIRLLCIVGAEHLVEAVHFCAAASVGGEERVSVQIMRAVPCEFHREDGTLVEGQLEFRSGCSGFGERQLHHVINPNVFGLLFGFSHGRGIAPVGSCFPWFVLSLGFGRSERKGLRGSDGPRQTCHGPCRTSVGWWCELFRRFDEPRR